MKVLGGGHCLIKSYKGDTFRGGAKGGAPPCLRVSDANEMYEWPPFGHESIEHEPLTALEQWKSSRHRSLWLMVSN